MPVGDPNVQGSTVPGVVTVSYDPYVEQRYLLAPGRNYTQIYTQTGKSYIPPRLDPVDQSSFTITDSTKFNGITTVTVPAGSFEVCEFVDDFKVVDNGAPLVRTYTVTSWVGIGNDNGILIKHTLRNPFTAGTTSGVSVTRRELLMASVDGEPIKR